MEWINDLGNVNYIAVAVATISSYVLGFVWYHWQVFGKAWAKSLGLTKEDADNTEGLGGVFIISLLGGLTKTVCMAVLMFATNTTGVIAGAFFGTIIALALIATSIAYYNGFARASSQLTWINVAHGIIELTVIGAIIGAFS